MTGSALEAVRKQTKVVREELAERAGLSYARIQRAEEARDTEIEPDLAHLCVSTLVSIQKQRLNTAQEALSSLGRRPSRRSRARKPAAVV